MGFLLLPALVVPVFLVCVALGSVPLPLDKTFQVLWGSLWGQSFSGDREAIILLSVRLPRVINVFLTGASLALCGAAMQGLLRNPLAEGGTLGVSSGASLGAMLAIMIGFSLPGLELAGTAVLAVIAAFFSLLMVLALAFMLDRSLATHTIILIGIIFTMFVGSLMSLLIAFSGAKLRSLTFWTLGSLASTGYSEALLLFITFLVCGAVLMKNHRELDAFSLGEQNARHIGVAVKKVKLTVMIAVSALIGVCVSVGGTIGFVGLVIPHITRAIIGPSHRHLLPASVLIGGVFLMLSDLLSRTLLSPIELPLGVITSLIGAVFFVGILLRRRKGVR